MTFQVPQSSEDKRATSCECLPQPSRTTIIFNMPKELAYGRYHIASVQREEQLGVSTEPDISSPPPAPVVVLPRGVLPPEVILMLRVIREDSTDLDLPQFTIVPVNVEANAYIILVEKRVTGDQEDLVFASTGEPAEVWLITYCEIPNACGEPQKGYTIQKRDGISPFLGWTAPPRDGAQHPNQRKTVV
ncbi:hypothetical protein EDD16DRAFT_1798278 [Pisolithus croceorrhizus]|nr:hypothetical protein EDD16DRAFT_1798278 [Pisolithus croceorrhizus]